MGPWATIVPEQTVWYYEKIPPLDKGNQGHKKCNTMSEQDGNLNYVEQLAVSKCC